MYTPIKFWAEDDQPREKLLLKGKSVLSDAELLAIIIGSGTKNESAVQLAQRILYQYNNQISEIAKLSIKQLTAFKGIGEAKAIAIVAALELAKRKLNEEPTIKPKICCSKDIFSFMYHKIGELYHEEFWVIYLNNSNHVVYEFQLSKGGIVGTLVDLRIIFKYAFEHFAVSIVICHNHPSGSLTPSQHDLNITKKIKTACENLDIKLIDHIILTEKSYYSFADSNMI